MNNRYKHLGYSYNQNEKVEKMHSFETSSFNGILCIDFSSKILREVYKISKFDVRSDLLS